MFLVPVSAFLPLCRERPRRALSVLLDRGELNLRGLIDAGFSRKSAWQTIRALKDAEFVIAARRGRYVANEFLFRDGKVLLNPWDAMLERVLKSSFTRRLLKAALVERNITMSRLASLTGASLRNTIRVVKDLQSSGILSESLQPHFLYEPEKGVERLPRLLHRKVFEHFLKCMENYGSLGFTSTVIVFGPAADGLLLQPVGVACLVSLAQRAEEYARLAFSLVLSKDNVKDSFGVDVDPVIVVENAYLATILDILAKPNNLLTCIVQGIRIYGKSLREEDYFEVLNRTAPLTEDEIREKIKKGYVVAVGDRLLFTDKAIETLRTRAPTHITEAFIPVDRERAVKLISVGKTMLPQ